MPSSSDGRRESSDGRRRRSGGTAALAYGTAGQTIHAVWDETGVVFADVDGEVLIERGWPPKGLTDVSNGIRRGRPSK